jgi:hypothetical protein
VKHCASPKFWRLYVTLPENIRQLADDNFALLKHDPRHPSLRFKKVGSIGPRGLAFTTGPLLSNMAGISSGFGLATTTNTIN